MEKSTAPVNVAILLFDGFETLDVFGPAEILGRLTDQYSITFYSEEGKIVHNQHGISMITQKLSDIAQGAGILLIPGGPGIRREVANRPLIDEIRKIADASKHVLTVCTGSSLLAQTGLLNGRKATSNKRVFDWATTFGENVQWVREARWTADEKYYTSSGVSAGMDMTLGFLRDVHGADFARKVARHIEYHWQEDSNVDLFSGNGSENIPGINRV